VSDRKYLLLAVSVVLLALALSLGTSPANAQTAKITAIVLKVTHRPGPTGTWTRSNVGALLPSGSRVRTAKRSKCEIKFPDGSLVRMGPRSELVIHDPGTKRLQVLAGQILAHVVTGTSARIQGASATAAVKGTWVLYQGPTAPGVTPPRTYDQFGVWAGEANFSNAQGTQTVGDQQASGAPPGQPPGPVDFTYPFWYANGTLYPWWFGLMSGVEIDATPGTDPGQGFKNDTPTQHEMTGNVLGGVLGGDLELTVRSPGAVPAVTGSSLGALNALAAAGMSQIYEQKRLGRHFFGPRSQVDTFGMLYEGGSLGGIRARSNGIYKTWYFEAGVRAVTDFSGDWDTSASELFAVDRLGNTDVIMGRQRYLEGPVNNSAVGALFGSVYFDGISIRHRTDKFSALAAWVDDYDAPNAVGGWLARGAAPVAGGQAAVTLFAQRHNDLGWSADVTIPAIRDKLDIYAEAGQDPAGNQLGTIGAYFPDLYQRSNVDLFIEYGDRQGAPSSLSAMAYYQGPRGWSGLAGIQRQGGEWAFSVGVVNRFGSLK